MATTVITYAGRSILTSRLKGAGTEPLNIGWGQGTTTTSANSDVALFRQSASVEARTAGTSTFQDSAANTTKLADVYQVTGTITALGTLAVTEVALHDTATSLSPMTTWATAPTTTAGTTGTLTSATGAQGGGGTFPGSGNYYIQCENEIMLVTAGQGTTSITVTRAVLGSTAATHANGTFVTLGGDGGARAGNSATSDQTATVNAAVGGSMFLHGDFAVINLLTSDSILFTIKTQFS